MYFKFLQLFKSRKFIFCNAYYLIAKHNPEDYAGSDRRMKERVGRNGARGEPQGSPAPRAALARANRRRTLPSAGPPPLAAHRRAPPPSASRPTGRSRLRCQEGAGTSRGEREKMGGREEGIGGGRE